MIFIQSRVDKAIVAVTKKMKNKNENNNKKIPIHL